MSGWGQSAACRDHPTPDWWFPNSAGSPEAVEAKKVCAGCPVRRDCGLDAVKRGERHGIAAGFFTPSPRDWMALHDWLGLERPSRSWARRKYRLVVCGCGEEFETRRTDLHRCGPCQQGLVPSAATQAHIQRLRDAGLIWREIAEPAGLDAETVRAIPRQAWVKARTEQQILAVAVPDEAVAS